MTRIVFCLFSFVLSISINYVIISTFICKEIFKFDTMKTLVNIEVIVIKDENYLQTTI
jgi:hypothetical protein